MTNFKVRLTAGARRDFKALPKNTRDLFWNELRFIASTPNPKICLERVKGHPELFKIRKGDFRLVLEVWEDELVLLVVEAGPRKTIYRKYQS